MESLKTMMAADSALSISALIAFFAMLFGISRLPKKKLSFAWRTLIGTGAGCVFGLLIWAASQNSGEVSGAAASWAELICDGFLQLFKMLLGVAVFTAAVRFILHTPIEDVKDKNKKQRRNITGFMVFASAAIGLITAVVMGAGNVPGQSSGYISSVYTIPDYASALLPSDFLGDLLKTNIIGIIAAAWFIGVAARRMAVKRADEIKPFVDLIDGFFTVLTSVCKAVIAWKPVGAAAITSSFIIAEGPSAILKFLWLIAVLIAAVFFMAVFQLAVIAVSGVNPVHFIRESSGLIKQAAVTHSGGGCIEPAKSILIEKFGVSREIAEEVVPYSMTSGMQGCAAAFPAVVFVFAANMAGMTLDVTTVFVGAVLITAVSFAITGLPGTATMAEFAVVLGMPLKLGIHNIGPAVALDPVADVIRTPLNVTGAMANAIYISNKRGRRR